MAYIGRNPAIGTQKVLDSLESQFNGTKVTFDLRYSSNTVYPPIASALIVSLGGVLQEPGTAYTVASDTITFASAPTAGTDCWILLYTEFGGALGPIVDLTVSNNLTIGNELHGPANFVIDPAAIGDNTGTVEIKGNLTVQGTQTTVNSTTVDLDHLSLGDNEIANFGDGDDLEIYHDGSNSYIKDVGTGSLIINAGQFFIKNQFNTETHASFNSNGAVELYYDNSKKLETTNTGVTITGTAVADGLSLGDNEVANFGDSNDLKIYHSGTNSQIRDEGTGRLFFASNGEGFGFIKVGGGTIANLYTDGAVELYYDTSKKFETTSTGVTVTGTVAADGLSLGDNNTANFGGDNDLQIRHNNSNSIIEHNGTGNLYIQTTGDNEDLYLQSADNVLIRSQGSEDGIRVIGNGAVELYYNNAKKLETTSTGITITGTVGADGFSLQDNETITFGEGADLQIYHNGTNSYIQDAGTGALIFKSDLYSFRNDTDTEQLAKFIEDGAVELYYDNSKKLETTSTGVDVTGHTETDTLNVSGLTTVNSLQVDTFSTFNGNTKHFDGKFANFGNSTDLQIVHDGNNSVIQNATGQFFIDNNASGGDLFLRANDDVVIRVDGNDTILTAKTGGVEINGDIEIAEKIIHTGDTNTHVSFPSSDYIRLTTSNSSRLNVTPNGYILLGLNSEPSGGDAHARNARLLIQGRIGNTADSGRLNLQRGSAASNGSSIGSITFTDNSNNAYARIETIADAAPGANDFPGKIVFSTTPDGSASPTESLRITSAGYVSIPDDSGRFTAGSSNDLQIYHDGSNSYVEDAGTGALIMKGSTIRIRSTTNENMLSASQNGAISLYHDNNVKLETTSTGIDVTGKTDTDTLNVSGLSTFQGTLEFDSTLQSYDPAGGSGSDTSTNAAIALPSGKQIVGYDDGYIRNLLSWNNGSNIIIGQQNTSKISGIDLKPGNSAGVGLHYGGATDNLKFRTTSTGVDVLGGIDVEGGDIVFDSDTESNFLYISRYGNTSTEFTRISRGDVDTTFFTKNDEERSTIRFRIQNTDTEAGGGANANDRNIDLISDQTNARIVIDGNTVWHAGNDGSASGLDADTLDGQQGSYYTNAANLTGTLPAIDGSNLTGLTVNNANTLDNLDSTQFLRSDTGDTATGLLDLNGGIRFVTTNAGGNGLSFVDNGYQTRWDGRESITNQTVVHKFSRQGYNTGNFNAYVEAWYDSANYHTIGLSTGGVLQYDSNTVWHAGNDGSGSGLDADTVDSIQANSIPYATGSSQFGTTPNTNPTQALRSGFFDVNQTNAPTSTWYSYINIRHTNTSAAWGHQIAGSFFSNGDLYNRHYDSGSFAAWTKIWNAANDGSGSGLDADTLDGVQGANFLRSNTTDIYSGGTLTIKSHSSDGSYQGWGVYFGNSNWRHTNNNSWGYALRNNGNSMSIKVSKEAGTTDSVATFNDYTFSGGSTASITAGGSTVWHAGNDGSGTGLDADLLDGHHRESSAATGNTVAGRNSSGDIHCRLIRQTYQNQSTISGGMVYRVNNGSDNYLRVCNSPSAIRTFLGVSATGGDANYLNVAGDTATGTMTFNGRVNIRGHIDLSDGEELCFGSSDDVKIRYLSSNWMYWNFGGNGNGLVFQDNGSDKVVLEDSGVFRPSGNNTGSIGTSSNRWANIWATKINFAANSTDTANITTTVSGNNTYLDFNLTDDNNQEQFRWRFDPSGSSSVYNAMQLKPTANGESTLIVSGDIGIGATPGSNLAGRAHCLAIGDSDTGIAQNGDGQFEIWANNQEICNFDTGEIHALKALRVANDFRVATTNTFPGHGNGNGGFHVEDASQGTSMFCSRKDNTAAYFNRNNNGGIVSFRRNGNEKGQVVMNSNSVSYQTTSDYRLKENVVVLDNAISRVKQLQPKRFNFIGDPDEILDGFLAHEAQAVVPESVSGTQDEVEIWKESEELPDGVFVGDNKLDEQGNTIPVYQGIDQAKLVPLLTAALQEAITKIEQLEARITQLEST